MVTEKIKYLGRKEVLKALNCSNWFLHKLEHTGRLRKKRIGRKVYFSIEEINQLIESNNQ